jgi:hypothetical protein
VVNDITGWGKRTAGRQGNKKGNGIKGLSGRLSVRALYSPEYDCRQQTNVPVCSHSLFILFEINLNKITFAAVLYHLKQSYL